MIMYAGETVVERFLWLTLSGYLIKFTVIKINISVQREQICLCRKPNARFVYRFFK
jgi:hypothetical protein